MAVSVINSTRQRIDGALARRAAETALAAMKRSGDLNIIFIGDRRMRTLNRTYRRKDKTTDILSFAETEQPGFLGELFIDYEVIKKQARRYSPSIRFELAFIVIHGVLHLIGYEDETETGAAEMERLGTAIIKKVSL